MNINILRYSLFGIAGGSFFFADSRRKYGYQPVKSLYFCVDQQKGTAILGHVNLLNVYRNPKSELSSQEKKWVGLR